MKGIYVIADEGGRVYYVGQSGQLENRAWGHLTKIKQDENKYDKNKMYWLLGRMYNDPLFNLLHCYILEKWSMENNIDLKKQEKEWIRQLKPVLNTQVPVDCVCYMEDIECMVEAVAQAEQNGRWDFSDCEVIW